MKPPGVPGVERSEPPVTLALSPAHWGLALCSTQPTLIKDLGHSPNAEGVSNGRRQIALPIRDAFQRLLQA